MACSTSPSGQGSLSEVDKAAGVAEQLIHIFGDEEDDKSNITNSTSNKTKYNYGNTNGVQITSSKKIMQDCVINCNPKRRRYRTIRNLYMSTKPINNLDWNK